MRRFVWCLGWAWAIGASVSAGAAPPEPRAADPKAAKLVEAVKGEWELIAFDKDGERVALKGPDKKPMPLPGFLFSIRGNKLELSSFSVAHAYEEAGTFAVVGFNPDGAEVDITGRSSGGTDLGPIKEAEWTRKELWKLEDDGRLIRAVPHQRDGDRPGKLVTKKRDGFEVLTLVKRKK